MTESLLGSAKPIVAAPMAGGPSTVALVLAAAEAGAFPFLAGANKTPEVLADEIEQLRASGHRFGVNLFVLDGAPPVDPEAFRNYVDRMRSEADRYGVSLSDEPVVDNDYWDEKIDLLMEQPVPVVSFTFGLPTTAVIAELQSVGTKLFASVTTPAEAQQAEAGGVDGLVVQGPRAGGHSATFDQTRDIEDVATAELVAQVRAVSQLPIIAGGGVDGPEAVRALLAAGADAVSVGTLLLRSDEAGTSPTHRAALADGNFTDTALTRAFTGRPARSLRNDFVNRHDADAVSGYPAVHILTRDFRKAAGQAGDPHAMHLWAGTGWRNARPGPVADIIKWLAP